MFSLSEGYFPPLFSIWELRRGYLKSDIVWFIYIMLFISLGNVHLEIFMVVGKQENKKRIVSVISVTIVGLLCLMVVMPIFASADTEPNDSVYTADPISSGDIVYGTLSDYSDRDDYYSIYLSQGDRLYTTLSGTGDDFDLYIYSSSTNDVASSTSGDSSESLRYTAPSSGTYYVNPYAYSGSGSYTLSVSVNQDIVGGGDSFDWLIPLIVIIIIVIIVIALAVALRPKHTPGYQPQYQYGSYEQGQYAPPPPAPGGQYAPPPPAVPPQQAPQPEGGGFCGSCGAKMNPGYSLCPNCGTKNR